jgi:hypothetical protein
LRTLSLSLSPSLSLSLFFAPGSSCATSSSPSVVLPEADTMENGSATNGGKLRLNAEMKRKSYGLKMGD